MKRRYALAACAIAAALCLTSCSAMHERLQPSSSSTPAISTTEPSPLPEETLSSTATAMPAPTSEAEGKAAFIQMTRSVSATTIIDISGMDEKTLDACFTSEAVPDAVFARMEGKTFGAKCTTKRSDLRYIRVLHHGFDGKTHAGELVANKKITQDMLEIFRELYRAKYPIEKMKLADDYNADDNASMADNNTSCFNFRTVEGSKTLSKHAYGLAIDINPLYNPYIVTIKGERKIEPDGSAPYADRTVDLPYIIKKGDILHRLFMEHGFKWGGDWKEPDYQHFSKV